MEIPSRSTVEAILRKRLEVARTHFEATDAHLLSLLENIKSVNEPDRVLARARYERWRALEDMSRILDEFENAVLYGTIPHDFTF